MNKVSSQNILNGDFETEGFPSYCPCPMFYDCENDAGQVFDGVDPLYDWTFYTGGCLSGTNWTNHLGAHSGSGYVYFYAGSDQLNSPPRYFTGNDTINLCVWYAGPQFTSSPQQNGPNCYFSFGMDGQTIGQNISVPLGTGWTQHCFSFIPPQGVHTLDLLSGGGDQYSIWFDDWNIQSNQIFDVDIGNDTTLCSGDSLLLDATTAGAAYLWQDGSTDPTNNVTSSGVYWVEVTTQEGTSTASLSVQYYGYPVVDLGHDTTLCPGEQLLLDVTSSYANTLFEDGTSVLWHDGSVEDTYLISEEGNYSVIISRKRCTSYDSIEVKYVDCPLADGVDFPNIITPNNDGVNDFFEFPGGSPLSIIILNRWGEEVYNGAGPWDGSSAGIKCADGTYFWIAKFSDISGEVHERYGHVSLIK